MQKRFIIIVILTGFALRVNCQAVFQRIYGGALADLCLGLQVTTDGGYMICGNTHTFDTTGAYYLLRTDANGNTIWSHYTGANTTDDDAWALQQTADGGFIIAGETEGFGAGLKDFYLVKLNSAGTVLWSKTYGSGDWDRARSIEIMSDGGFAIGGTKRNSNDDLFIVRTNSLGDTLWTRSYGGISWEYGGYLVTTPDGGLALAGGTGSYGAGGRDMYVVKTDANGNVLWTRTYGGANDDDEAFAITGTAGGGLILAGYTQSFGSPPGRNIYVVRTNNLGDTLWTKAYAHIGSLFADALSIKSATNGEFIIGGYTQVSLFDSDMIALNIDSAGSLIWAKTYGGTGVDAAYSVAPTNDGGFVLGGIAENFGFGDLDLYLVKVDSNGFSGGCNELNANVNAVSTPTLIGSGVTLINGCQVTTPVSTTSIGLQMDSILCLLVAIEETTHASTSSGIFPNPLSTSTTVYSEINLTNATLTVVNCFGQTVNRVTNINGHTIILHRNNLASGIYFVHLTQDNQIVATDKLVITD